MKAIIIDDEEPSRIILEQLLKWHCPEIELMAKCAGVDEGLLAIKQHEPNVVFLDIAMPNKNGFDLFKELDEVNFDVVFTTAYDEFAIEAFKVHASAYLLKPIDKDLLIATIENINKKMDKRGDAGQIQSLLKMLQVDKPRTGKVAIPTMEGIEYVETNTITRCLAEGNYTRIFIEDGAEIYVSKSLKIIESLIDNNIFIRPHNSHLVNSKKIKKYVKGSGGYLVLDDETTIPVSRTRKDVIESI